MLKEKKNHHLKNQGEHQKWIQIEQSSEFKITDNVLQILMGIEDNGGE